MTNDDTYYSRQLPRDRSLRASDQDRQAVADILRRAHVAGRLDPEEYADRYGRCLEAKTYADLDQLVADLPDEEPAWASAAPWPRPGTPPPWHGAPWQGGTPQNQRPGRSWLFLPIAVLATWLVLAGAVFALSGGHLFWLGFPLLFFFVWRPMRRWRRWGPPPGHWAGRDGGDAWRL
jgi:hypothetical protein